MDAELRQRAKAVPDAVPAPNLVAGVKGGAPAIVEHPSGKEGHGKTMQILRGILFAIFFFTTVVAYVTASEDGKGTWRKNSSC